MKRLLLYITLLLPVYGSAQMTTRVIADNLFIPWELVYGPDDHIWFTQKNGYICRLDPVTSDLDTLYHETNTSILSEGGMLGLALHPDFTNTPEVFVAYNYMQGGSDYKERIVKYTYSGGVLTSPQILLDNIDGANFHNGCRLLIVDGKLIATTGDATVTSVSQDPNNINGKTLRMNLDGSIPSDNPDPASYVWTTGHRNAQGMDYANGKLYQSEHGPNNDDELNIIEKGRNYGWPNVEGYCNTSAEITFCTTNNVKEPIEAWTPTLAVSDIAYYDHPMFPSLQKSIIMATLKDETLYSLKLNSTLDDVTSSSTINVVSGDRLRALCVSPDGAIYISTSNSPSSGSGSKTDKIIELYDPSYTNVSKLTNNLGFNLYPNPANNTIHIVAKNMAGQNVQYSICNTLGQICDSGNFNTSSHSIDIAHLQNGIYYIKLTGNDNHSATKRIVKQ
jgi:Glucose/sorbosone dehydrogenases